MFIADKVKDDDIDIRYDTIDTFDMLSVDEFGDIDYDKCMEVLDEPAEYDFYKDEIVEMQRMVNPVMVIPQDGLRYSIINILAYCLTKLVNTYMSDYTKNSNSYDPNRPCALTMKNEFLFRRMLVTMVKKNYASIQELQEGNRVPENKSLDVKGLVMDKSVLSKKTQDKLQRILYEDILRASKVDQIQVLKSIGKLEKEIYNNLASGKKDYYSPSIIKPMSMYPDPMRQSGIKASVAWNELVKDDLENIDLNQINAISAIKVNINAKNASCVKESYPEIYDRIMNLLKTNEKFKKGITSVAMPLEVETPEWLFNFIDYGELIHKNISSFPLQSIGLQMQEGNVSYTNILEL